MLRIYMRVDIMGKGQHALNNSKWPSMNLLLKVYPSTKPPSPGQYSANFYPHTSASNALAVSRTIFSNGI